MGNQFSSVDRVLNKVMSNLGLDKRLREHTFMSLWSTFVSSAIADRSRPLFIDGQRHLVISVADASTGQELSMCKGKVLGSVMRAARSLGIEITGLRLDLKHYHASSTLPFIQEEPRPLKPTEEELAAIRLGQDDRQQLAALQTGLEGDDTVDENLRNKLVRVFERELRIRQWRLENGFPRCGQCGNPQERLHQRQNGRLPREKGAPVCLSCLYE